MEWRRCIEFTLEQINIVQLQALQTVLDGFENMLKNFLSRLLSKPASKVAAYLAAEAALVNIPHLVRFLTAPHEINTRLLANDGEYLVEVINLWLPSKANKKKLLSSLPQSRLSGV